MAEHPRNPGDPALEPSGRHAHADMPFAGIEEVEGLEAARLDLCQVGYCIVCDRMIVRGADGSCPSGHPEQAVFGRMMLEAGEDVPQLPRFNLGAFLVPFLWGPGHHQWVGAFFFPIWLFMDSIIRSAMRGPAALKVAAAVVVVGTLAFQAHFATRANGMAWRRVADKMTIEQFVRRERWWTLAMVPLFIIFVSWAVWYDLALLR